MNKYIYEDFAIRYRVQSMRIQRSPHHEIWHPKSLYDSSREEIVEMELPRNQFDRLVEVDDIYTRMRQDECDERSMRKEHPAIKEAYDRYKLILELYK